MTDWIDGKCNPGRGAAVPDIGAWVQQADPDLGALLQLFLDQEWPIRSIVVGYPQACGELSQDAHIVSADGAHTDAFLLRLPVDQHAGSSSIVRRVPLRASRRSPGGVHVYTCEDLVLQAHQLISDGPANDLLLWQ